MNFQTIYAGAEKIYTQHIAPMKRTPEGQAKLAVRVATAAVVALAYMNNVQMPVILIAATILSPKMGITATGLLIGDCAVRMMGNGLTYGDFQLFGTGASAIAPWAIALYYASSIEQWSFEHLAKNWWEDCNKPAPKRDVATPE